MLFEAGSLARTRLPTLPATSTRRAVDRSDLKSIKTPVCMIEHHAGHFVHRYPHYAVAIGCGCRWGCQNANNTIDILHRRPIVIGCQEEYIARHCGTFSNRQTTAGNIRANICREERSTVAYLELPSNCVFTSGVGSARGPELSIHVHESLPSEGKRGPTRRHSARPVCGTLRRDVPRQSDD